MLIAILSALALPTIPMVSTPPQDPDPRWVWCVSSEVDYGRNHSVSHVFSVPYHTNENAVELDFYAYVDSEWARAMGPANCTFSLSQADAVQLRKEFIAARHADNHFVSEEDAEDWVWDGD